MYSQGIVISSSIIEVVREEDQALTVSAETGTIGVVVPDESVQNAGDKAAVVEKLEALLNRRAEKVRDIPEDEIDSVIDEAVDHARQRRR